MRKEFVIGILCLFTSLPVCAEEKSPDQPLQGETVSASVHHSGQPPTARHIRLTGENGISDTAQVTTVGYRRHTIRLNENGYLISPDGSLFYPVGGFYANWPHTVPDADGVIRSSMELFPCNDSPYLHGFPWKEEVEQKVIAYLDHCQKHGVNTLRLMLRNMDLVGRVDPVQLQAVLHLFDLARPRGILFNVVLFEDYEKPPYYSPEILKKIVLPHYTSEELQKLPSYRKRFLVDGNLIQGVRRFYLSRYYSDPDLIRCHKDYLKELIPILAAREEVLCYELENEMFYFPEDWCREITACIRSMDPHTLILANPHPISWRIPIEWRDWRKSAADLIAFHSYNSGQAKADMGTVLFTLAKWTAQIGIPFGTGEGGVYFESVSDETRCPEQRVLAARDHIWMTFCAGGNASLYWTIVHENIIGEFGKIAPVIQAFGLDLKTMKRRRPPVAVVMPAKGQNANQNAADMAKRLLELGVDFDMPSIDEAGHYAVCLDAMTAKAEEIRISETLRPAVARPATGWDLATLLADDGQTAVLYLRNTVGGIGNYGTDEHPFYFRNVRPDNATLQLEQPEHWNKIMVYELDSKTVREIKPDKEGYIRLGTTQSDFLIGLRNLPVKSGNKKMQ
ncbi:MAG: hypothetical protein LBP50_03280 [Tannerella sp.]|jgi:hypothetical protein|nr:hypothetical protein [Tannerella sp.]